MAGKTATKDEIIALEKDYWDAMKRKDGARTSQLAGKLSLTTGARGVTTIAKDKMGKMTEEGNWTLDSYTFDDVEVITPAPDVAIIAYKVTQNVTMDGKQQELRAADSSTWIRGEDGWECHAHSEAFLQNAKGA
ncbi:MAG: nuclear transport factor 2 family protein [Terricaulis sp.]